MQLPNADVLPQCHLVDNLTSPNTIGLYHEGAIAIESDARDCLNVWSKAEHRAFARKERNLHCDVHVAAENKRTLPLFGSLDSFWIDRSDPVVAINAYRHDNRACNFTAIDLTRYLDW